MQRGQSLGPVNGLHSAAFEIVITAIQHHLRLGKLVKIPGQDILDEFIRRTTGFGSPPIKSGFQVGVELYFHFVATAQLLSITLRLDNTRVKAAIRDRVNPEAFVLRSDRQRGIVALTEQLPIVSRSSSAGPARQARWDRPLATVRSLARQWSHFIPERPVEEN